MSPERPDRMATFDPDLSLDWLPQMVSFVTHFGHPKPWIIYNEPNNLVAIQFSMRAMNSFSKAFKRRSWKQLAIAQAST